MTAQGCWGAVAVFLGGFGGLGGWGYGSIGEQGLRVWGSGEISVAQVRVAGGFTWVKYGEGTQCIAGTCKAASGCRLKLIQGLGSLGYRILGCRTCSNLLLFFATPHSHRKYYDNNRENHYYETLNPKP